MEFSKLNTQTVADLTGLSPAQKPQVQEDLRQILEMTGHNPAEFGIEELRKAMIAYLESIQAEIA